MRRPIGRPSAEEAPKFGDLATLLINEYKANARRSADRVADALEHLQAFFTIFALARAVATDLTACHKAGFAKVVSEKPCVVVALRASRTTSAGPLSGTWSAQGCRALPR